MRLTLARVPIGVARQFGFGKARPLSSERKTLRSLCFGGLRVEEVQYAPGHVQPPHAHTTPSFGVVLEGGLTERAEGRADVAIPGSIV